MDGILGSKALELAISLSLFFFLSSLICTAAREMIEAVMKTRAGDLERALRELLGDPDGTGTVRELFTHPTVAGLFLGRYDSASLQTSEPNKPTAGLTFAERRNLPSYIPAGQFAAALVDIVVRGGEEVPYAPPRPQGPVSLADLRAQLERMADPALARALQVATDGVATLDEAKLRIEAWFNGSMDRASGWYKRRTQWILFALGLATAVLMNLDTITVTRRLFVDGDLRDAAVHAAEARVTAASASPAATSSPPPLAPSPTVTDAPLALASAPTAPADLRTTALATRDTVQALRDDMAEIGFPMGWTLTPVPWPAAQARLCQAAANPCGLTRWYRAAPTGDGRVMVVTAGSMLLMPLGWLITALAVTLGAPFWFDLLNKFIIVRSTVKPAQKSQDEASPEPTLKASAPGGDMLPGDEQSVARRAAATGTGEPATPAVPGPVDPLVINRWAIGTDPDEGLL